MPDFVMQGERVANSPSVTVNGHEVDAEEVCLLRPEYGTSMDWGRFDNGAKLLALYVLTTVIPLPPAIALHLEFARNCIAKLAHEGWALTRTDVVAWLLTQEVSWELAVGGPGTILDVSKEQTGPLQPSQRPAMM